MQYPEPEWFTDEYLDSLYTLLEVLGANQEAETIKIAFSTSSDVFEDLQVEYTRLFINGSPHVIAPPYGSVYIDKSLQGKHSEKTLQFYTSHGYSLKSGRELPDHIVHQLEFLSLLADQGDAATEAQFLNSIFLPWFPQFHARVKQDSIHPFYSVIVQLIDYLTKEDDEHGIQLDEA
jgi:TorA maturation chaperone TorD